MKESQKLLSSFVVMLAICAAGAALLSRLGITIETPSMRIQLADLSRTQVIEIHDAGGRLALRGQLETLITASDQLRRSAILSSAGSAIGLAEIELTRHRDGTITQELEVDVDDLPPGSLFTVMLDGRPTGTLTTDSDGAAELDRYGRAHVTSWQGAD